MLSLFICIFLYCFVSISQVIGCEDRLRNDLYCVGWGVKLYSNQTKYSSSQGCHTATGTHMPYGITQCYLPPGRGDIPALCAMKRTERERVHSISDILHVQLSARHIGGTAHTVCALRRGVYATVGRLSVCPTAAAGLLLCSVPTSLDKFQK